jgi:hypothetical protein
MMFRVNGARERYMRLVHDDAFEAELLPPLLAVFRSDRSGHGSASPFFVPSLWEPFHTTIAERVPFYTVVAALDTLDLQALAAAAHASGDLGFYLYNTPTRTLRERTLEEQWKGIVPNEVRQGPWRIGPNLYFPIETAADRAALVKYHDWVDADMARPHLLVSPAATWGAVVSDGLSWVGGAVPFVKQYLIERGRTKTALTEELLQHVGLPWRTSGGQTYTWLPRALTHAYGAEEAQDLLTALQ